MTRILAAPMRASSDLIDVLGSRRNRVARPVRMAFLPGSMRGTVTGMVMARSLDATARKSIVTAAFLCDGGGRPGMSGPHWPALSATLRHPHMMGENMSREV